jgi:hypothetical protein
LPDSYLACCLMIFSSCASMFCLTPYTKKCYNLYIVINFSQFIHILLIFGQKRDGPCGPSLFH